MLGSYSFESSTPDANSSSLIGNYNNALTALSFSLAGYQGNFRSGSDNTIVVDMRFGQYVAFVNFTGPSVNSFSPHDFGFSLTDTDLTALTSDALLLQPPDLSKFEMRGLGLSFLIDGTAANIVLEATELKISLVPEPSFLVTRLRFCCIGYLRNRSSSNPEKLSSVSVTVIAN